MTNEGFSVIEYSRCVPPALAAFLFLQVCECICLATRSMVLWHYPDTRGMPEMRKKGFYMDPEKLTELVTNLQKSEPNSDDAIRLAFKDKIYGHIMKRVDEDDKKVVPIILENVFSEIFASINTLRTPTAFVSWCNSITEHQIAAYFRKYRKKLNAEIEYSQKQQEELHDAKQDLGYIMECLPLLSAKHAEVVRMHVVKGVPVKEIAAQLGVPEGTVKSRLYYAREKLKNIKSKEK